MEELIGKVVDSYVSLEAKNALFEQRLEARENADMRDELTIIQIQIGVIESWFALLNIEERIVFRQLLLGSRDAASANRIAAAEWLQRLNATGRSLWQVRETAIQKVLSFARVHSPLMQALFQNI